MSHDILTRCHNQAMVELHLNAQSYFLANAPFVKPVASLIIIPLIFLVLQCVDNYGFFRLFFILKSHNRVFPYEGPNVQRSMWLKGCATLKFFEFEFIASVLTEHH